MKLEDFAGDKGFCPASEIKGWRNNHKGHAVVKAWIDAGYLFEPGTRQPSAIFGHLWLTATGREKARLGPVEVKKVVKPAKSEKQKELF